MFVSCKHETIDLYELDDAKIYFQVQSYSSANGAVGYSNSTDYSFVGVNQNVDGLTFKATIQMMGQVVDYDRECKITIDADSTTMVEGVDYEIDLDTLKIKAGQSKATFGVRFLRSQNIKEKKQVLCLKLLPNKYFQVLEKYRSTNVWSNTTAKEMDGSRFAFYMSEIYEQPRRWGQVNAGAYFGQPPSMCSSTTSSVSPPTTGSGLLAESAMDVCLSTLANCRRNCRSVPTRDSLCLRTTAAICSLAPTIR